VEKATTKLSAVDLVILFCAATGIDHGAVGILSQHVHSMAVRGFIVLDRERGAYALTDSGRATLIAVLEDIGLR
jgi:predicted transcriptional regulator